MSIEGAQRRTVRTLVTSQVLGGVGVSSGVAVGGLLAQDVSGATSLSGLAQTATVLGAAIAVIPMSRLMGVRGRRPGLAAGYAVGALGAVLLVLSGVLRLFPLLLLGALLFGAASAAGLQARYAATDLAAPTRRARDLSVVVWATTVGAVLGPNLVSPGAGLAGPLGLPALTGPYLLSVVVFAVAAVIVLVRLRPDPLLAAREQVEAAGQPRVDHRAAGSLRQSWRAVRASPQASLAVLAVIVAHTVMVAVMVMTPVHMRAGGDTLRLVGLVISGHVLGMYAFSPLFGRLADRVGRVPVVLAAQVVLVAACALAGSAGTGGAGTRQLATGLLLLGVGWSMTLVAGSALLAESVPEPARAGVQGLSDSAMGLAAASGGALAGVVVAGPGYSWLAAGSALLVLPVLALAAATRRSGVSAEFEQMFG